VKNVDTNRSRNPKPEIRNPKETRSPKSEDGNGTPGGTAIFGFRTSFGFRISDFGFRAPLLALFFAIASLGARASGPGDQVVVIYNTRVPESKDVADHYVEIRDVPTNQVFGLDLSPDEEISRTEFEVTLQRPLERLLQERKLWRMASDLVPGTNGGPATPVWRVKESRIRYAVLCYGVPLRIAKDPNLNEPAAAKLRAEFRTDGAAVDSELALLPLIEQNLPLSGPIPNPLRGVTNQAAMDPTNGVLMVARLDGPSPAIARALVDKAVEAERDGLWGRAYFDLRGITNSSYKLGDEWFRNAAELCRHLGFDTEIDDKESLFPVEYPMSQIAIYCGWLNESIGGAIGRPHVEFMPGAFAYHLFSFSAQSIRTTNRFWVGPLLARGATVTMGCVDEPLLQWTPNIPVVLSRLIYYGFSFGESAYAGQDVLSWQTTVVGDPLYRPFREQPELRRAQLMVRHSPLIEWWHLRAANLSLARGLPAKSVVDYIEELPIHTNSAILSEKLGELYSAEGRPGSAVKEWERALTLNPSPQQRVRLRITLADHLIADNRLQDASDDLNKLLAEDTDYPDLAVLYRRLLAIEIKLGHRDEIAKWAHLLNEPIPDQ
jgi:uncharacterized protein (TIGR03790 family)